MSKKRKNFRAETGGEQKRMMKSALNLAARGLSVLPMHSVHHGRCACSKGDACDRIGKHPVTLHGVNDATTKRDQIKSWWTASPDANIGIATGSASGILVMDIDPRNGGERRLERPKKKVGSAARYRHCPHGRRWSSFGFQVSVFRRSQGHVWQEIRQRRRYFLSDGSIMVAPPSRHAAGKRYRWKEGKSFRDLEPATLPKTWLDHLRSNGSVESGKDNPSAQTDARVLEGQRNTHLTSLAGTLQRGGVSPAAITAALIEENKAKCSPPLDRSEIKKIAASITKYAPTAPISDGADDAERSMQLVLERSFSRGKHLMLGTDGRFWHYDVRLWRPVSDQWVSKIVSKLSRPIRSRSKTRPP